MPQDPWLAQKTQQYLNSPTPPKKYQRMKTLSLKPKGKRTKIEATCSNCCEDAKIAAKGECWPCYQYRRRSGKARPLSLMIGQGNCKTCGKTISALMQAKSGECKRCRDHFRHYKQVWPLGLKNTPTEIVKRLNGICSNAACGRQCKTLRCGYCQACYAFDKNHGRPPLKREMHKSRGKRGETS